MSDIAARLQAITEKVLKENQALANKLRDLQSTVDEIGLQAALDDLADKLESETTEALDEIVAVLKTPPTAA